MRQVIESINNMDLDGNPTGGSVEGTGINIVWQDGPLPRDISGNLSQPMNGAFIEGVLEAALQRLQFFQNSKYKCRENAIAITKIEEALLWLDHRSNDRLKRGVAGLNIV